MKRSSNSSTGTSRTPRSASTKRSVSARLLAAFATHRQRQADDDSLDLLLAREPRELGEPALGGSLLDDAERPRDVPVGSETATPVRAEP